MKKRIIVTPHNHFDPTWRRSFERKSHLGDVTLASYAELEEIIMDAWMELGQTFTEGQAAVLEKYLERNANDPEKTERLKKLISQKKICVPRAGHTVQDNNLPAPEGLIRNFLVAGPLYEALGASPEDLKLVWIEDSFGSSPNYPQIIRGVGAEAVCKFCYITPAENVWVGIDGSKVAVLDRFYAGFGIGGFEKQPYCPVCLGKGCEKCGRTGMDFVKPIGKEAIRATFEHVVGRLRGTELALAVIEVGGEEILPEPELGAVVSEMAEKYPYIDIAFGTSADIYGCVKPDLQKALEGNHAITPDLNPVFSGCYVSRIKTKQRVRELTYRLLALESRFADQFWRSQSPNRLPEDVGKAWKALVFCQFHDAITGTHIDNAYAEIMDYLDTAEAVVDKYAKADKKGEDEIGGIYKKCGNSHEIVFGENRITFGDTGIEEIVTGGKKLFRAMPYGRVRRPFCIGELCLEQDFGDAWATRVPPQFSPQTNWNLIPLGDFQRIKEIGEGYVVWEGKYTGTDYMVRKLEWHLRLSADKDGALRFVADVDWDTDSRRLKALFPVDSFGDSALFEVPFGHIERKYVPEKLSYEKWSPNSMEYPAQNFVLRTVGEGCGVAVMNRGLPCHRWYPGCLELSLLRSPQCHFCANEEAHYDFNDLSGLRDAGRHRFEFAVLPYCDGRQIGDIARLAHAYNQREKLVLPFEVEGEALITAFKPSEDGKAFVLRFYDPTGRGCRVSIDFEREVFVRECDMLESPLPGGGSEDEKVSGYTAELPPFRIATLRITAV